MGPFLLRGGGEGQLVVVLQAPEPVAVHVVEKASALGPQGEYVLADPAQGAALGAPIPLALPEHLLGGGGALPQPHQIPAHVHLPQAYAALGGDHGHAQIGRLGELPSDLFGQCHGLRLLAGLQLPEDAPAVEGAAVLPVGVVGGVHGGHGVPAVLTAHQRHVEHGLLAVPLRRHVFGDQGVHRQLAQLLRHGCAVQRLTVQRIERAVSAQHTLPSVQLVSAGPDGDGTVPRRQSHHVLRCEDAFLRVEQGAQNGLSVLFCRHGKEPGQDLPLLPQHVVCGQQVLEELIQLLVEGQQPHDPSGAGIVHRGSGAQVLPCRAVGKAPQHQPRRGGGFDESVHGNIYQLSFPSAGGAGQGILLAEFLRLSGIRDRNCRTGPRCSWGPDPAPCPPDGGSSPAGPTGGPGSGWSPRGSGSRHR